MKIILHGKLARLIGQNEFEIATDIPAEAIEGLSRQLEDCWPKDMLLDAVGFETQAKLYAPTTEKELHLVPAVVGGGGVARIIVGVAIMVAVVFSGGTWTPLAVAFFMAGASLAVSGVMQLFYKAPTLDFSKSQDPAASKYIGSGGNTTAIGTYRNIAYGRVRIEGHWLSLQVDAKTVVLGRFPTSPPA